MFETQSNVANGIGYWERCVPNYRIGDDRIVSFGEQPIGSNAVVPKRSTGLVIDPISVVAVGCSRLGSLLNPTPITEMRQMLRAAADVGINVFDTANIYGQGDSERELGRLFAKRSDIFIVTKGGYRFSSKLQLMSRLKPVLRPAIRAARLYRKAGDARGAMITQDFSAASLTASLEESLRRLRRDAIDGFLLHDPGPADLSEDGAWSILCSHKTAGKVRYIGVSVGDDTDLDEISRLPSCDILQAPLDYLASRCDTEGYRTLIERNTALFVREILRAKASGFEDNKPISISSALAAARSLPGVASVIVGLSSRDHLRSLLSAL
jgi:aryl-alcohol dehydrogenase-like predicted oxidoreductase